MTSRFLTVGLFWGGEGKGVDDLLGRLNYANSYFPAIRDEEGFELLHCSTVDSQYQVTCKCVYVFKIGVVFYCVYKRGGV